MTDNTSIEYTMEPVNSSQVTLSFDLWERGGCQLANIGDADTAHCVRFEKIKYTLIDM
jgi:hypothetical protein